MRVDPDLVPGVLLNRSDAAKLVHSAAKLLPSLNTSPKTSLIPALT